MSAGRHGKALFRGRTIPYNASLARALKSPLRALAAQQMHFHSLCSPDGWVAISADDLADELGCDGSTAWRALTYENNVVPLRTAEAG
jgi:hypothetical protein